MCCHANTQLQKSKNGPIRPTPLFSRDGGSPVWIPAFAGKHGLFVYPQTTANTF